MKANSLGGTYGGNCVAVAAASATLDVISQEGLVGNSRDMGRKIGEGIMEILDSIESEGLPNPIMKILHLNIQRGKKVRNISCEQGLNC